jgi:hypothetical protein
MLERRRQGNCTPQKKNSIEDLVGNEDNEYPVPDCNRAMINITTELSDAHKKFLKVESWTRSLRNSQRS